jgi:uncharacterized membrane protein
MKENITYAIPVSVFVVLLSMKILLLKTIKNK